MRQYRFPPERRLDVDGREPGIDRRTILEFQVKLAISQRMLRFQSLYPDVRMFEHTPVFPCARNGSQAI